MIEFKDKCGRRLVPGDLIVYGHALGRCAGLQYGKVLSVQLKKADDYRDGPRPTCVTVQGVDDEHWAAKPGEWKLLRKGTLWFSSRVLRVTRDQVPGEALALLDAATEER